MSTECSSCLRFKVRLSSRARVVLHFQMTAIELEISGNAYESR